MHDLPIRSSRHSSGERGLAILKLALPPEWILRTQSESDYGIDVEIEIADATVSGIILKGQVRTKTPISWRKDGSFQETFGSGKLYYWRMIRLPVVLFLVDGDSQEVFWVPASGVIPADASLPASLVVSKADELRSTLGKLESYARTFTPFFDARRQLYRIAYFLDCLAKHEELLNRDVFLPLEQDEYSSLSFVYDEALKLRAALGLSNQGIIPWIVWPVRSAAVFGDGEMLHYGVHDEAVAYLRPIVDEIKTAARAIIDQEEINFLNFSAKTALDQQGIHYIAPPAAELDAEFWEAVESHLDEKSAKVYNLAKQLRGA